MKTATKYTFRFYLKHLKRFPGLTFFAILGVLMAVSTSMALPFFYKDFVNLLAEEGSTASATSLLTLLFVIVAVDFLQWLSWRTASYAQTLLQPKVMTAIMNECFEILHRHSYNFFNNQFVGSLVKRVNRMARGFEDIMDRVFFDLIPMVLRVGIATVVLLSLHRVLGIALIVWTALFVGINFFLSLYKLKRYDVPKAAADSRVTAELADTITNNTNIKLFSSLSFEKGKFEGVSGSWKNKTLASWLFSAHIESIYSLLMVGLNFFVLFFALHLWKQGALSVGHFVLLQTYLLEIFSQLWDFGRSIRHIYESLADAEEMTQVLMMPYEIQDKPHAKNLQLTRGEVEFKNVSFSYDKQSGEDRESDSDIETGVIQRLSFSVKSGEKVALIGPSGGGKTTVMKLLLRLFDLDSGKILLDGQDISKVKQESLRSQIALVPQDPILFHRSLMENIRYGRLDATDEEVFEAARLAHCHEFISRFPRGYKTHVGERGVKLSGGERQRIAIARAILSGTKILILDEATSNLDAESEKYIKEAMARLMTEKTTFVIAHRLSTILDMDRILVLDSGRIVEEGDHESLVQEKGGLYKRLWELQVGAYLV